MSLDHSALKFGIYLSIMGKTITAVVVDDEANSRDILVQMLSFDKDIQVLGASENIDQAMQAVREHNPDILFLDIEMPKFRFEPARKVA